MGRLDKHTTANSPVLRVIATIIFVFLPILGFAFGILYPSKTDNSQTSNLFDLQLKRAPANITPTTVQEIKVDEISWKTYKDKDYAFEFQYPEDWGDVKISDENFIKILKNVPKDKAPDEKDLPKMIKDQRMITFERIPFMINIYVAKYTSDQYYLLSCDERCSLTNLLEQKDNNDKKSNTIISGYKSRVFDRYFVPSDDLLRTHLMISPKYYLKVEAWNPAYTGKNIINDLEASANEGKYFDKLIKLFPTDSNSISLKSNLKVLSSLVQSIKFNSK